MPEPKIFKTTEKPLIVKEENMREFDTLMDCGRCLSSHLSSNLDCDVKLNKCFGKILDNRTYSTKEELKCYQLFHKCYKESRDKAIKCLDSHLRHDILEK